MRCFGIRSRLARAILRGNFLATCLPEGIIVMSLGPKTQASLDALKAHVAALEDAHAAVEAQAEQDDADAAAAIDAITASIPEAMPVSSVPLADPATPVDPNAPTA